MMQTPHGSPESLSFRLASRLEELKAELAVGERRLMSLESERQEVRDTLLRISGAVQVLQEQLARDKVPAPSAEPIG